MSLAGLPKAEPPPPGRATPAPGAAGLVKRDVLEARRGRTLILGLGNDILCDDGVGLLAARRLAERVGDTADHAEACLATIDLLPLMAGYERVVVLDAYQAPDLKPGTPVRAPAERLPVGFGYRSFHTLPFAEMLEVGRALDLPMPGEVIVHGLAVEDPSSFGTTLTTSVSGAWESWVRRVHEEEFASEGSSSGVRSPR